MKIFQFLKKYNDKNVIKNGGCGRGRPRRSTGGAVSACYTVDLPKHEKAQTQAINPEICRSGRCQMFDAPSLFLVCVF